MSTRVSNSIFWLGVIGTAFGILSSFRIDVISTWETLGNMSGRAVFLIIAVVLLASGLFLKWRETKVTPRNVQHKIRQWLDTFKIQHGVYDFEPWHFTITLRFYNLPMYIGRPKTLAGRYIVLQARIIGVLPEDRAAFEALSTEEMSEFYSHLALETARARISFNANHDLSDVTINKQIPITNRLSESDIIESLNDIYLSAVVIWNTTALRLSESPKLTQPS